MAGSAARVVELDAFLPPDLVIRYQGVEHHIPATALTVDLVLSIQQAQDDLTGDDPDQTRWLAVQDRVADLLATEATPPLDLTGMPPAVMGALIGNLYGHALGATDQDGQSPPAPTSRTRTGTTTSSKSGRGRARPSTR